MFGGRGKKFHFQFERCLFQPGESRQKKKKKSGTPQYINRNLIQRSRIQECTECREGEITVPKETEKLLKGRTSVVAGKLRKGCLLKSSK